MASAIAGSVREALAAAFEQHYLPVLRLCVLLSGRIDVAEDLAHDAFVRGAPKLGMLKEDDVGPYLRKTVVNLWKNRLRRLAIERRHRAPAPDAQESSHPGVEDREVLWQVVARLPEKQRACLVLRYYEDLSERETAALLRCSVGTVKSHTSRALSRLRREMADDD